MSENENNEPAYPSFQVRRVDKLERIDVLHPGLTKRELLAAMAPAEIVRALTNRAEADVLGRGELLPAATVEGLASRYAVAAVAYADALLRELGK